MASEQRCKTCTWWQGGAGDVGECQRIAETNTSGKFDRAFLHLKYPWDRPKDVTLVLATTPDFGCVEWEAKTTD